MLRVFGHHVVTCRFSVQDHSRPQRPRSFWSAPRIATSGQVRFEWICEHNRLRPEPIRFVRLDSEHAQSDGKSVNRGLPVLDLARVQARGSSQRSRFLVLTKRSAAYGDEYVQEFLIVPHTSNFCHNQQRLIFVLVFWHQKSEMRWGRWRSIAILTMYKHELLYNWRFSRYSAPIHWLVHGHMTSNNETVPRQMPWAGNIAKTMTSNGEQFTVTREMLTAVAHDHWNLSAVLKFCFCFVLL